MADHRVMKGLCSSDLREKVLFQEQSLPVPFSLVPGLKEIGVGDGSSQGTCLPVAELIKNKHS